MVKHLFNLVIPCIHQLLAFKSQYLQYCAVTSFLKVIWHNLLTSSWIQVGLYSFLAGFWGVLFLNIQLLVQVLVKAFALSHLFWVFISQYLFMQCSSKKTRPLIFDKTCEVIYVKNCFLYLVSSVCKNAFHYYLCLVLGVSAYLFLIVMAFLIVLCCCKKFCQWFFLL